MCRGGQSENGTESWWVNGTRSWWVEGETRSRRNVMIIIPRDWKWLICSLSLSHLVAASTTPPRSCQVLFSVSFQHKWTLEFISSQSFRFPGINSFKTRYSCLMFSTHPNHLFQINIQKIYGVLHVIGRWMSMLYMHVKEIHSLPYGLTIRLVSYFHVVESQCTKHRVI